MSGVPGIRTEHCKHVDKFWHWHLHLHWHMAYFFNVDAPVVVRTGCLVIVGVASELA